MKIELEQYQLSRRQTLKWIAAAAGVISVWDRSACATPINTNKYLDELGPGIGTDPNLVSPVVPWKRIMTPEQLRATHALADVIVPADEHSPSAGSLKCHEFVDEWISAPYEQQQNDRKTITEGLAWLSGESQKRFNKEFADLDEPQKIAIVEDIAGPAVKKPFQQGASFFRRMRYLIVGAFYTTPEGMKDVGYVGNVPMLEYPGAPPEVLKHLGLL